VLYVLLPLRRGSVVLVALVVVLGVVERNSSFPRLRLETGGVGVDDEGEGALVTMDSAPLSARDLLRVTIVDSNSKGGASGSILCR
jgi:hypothetical protein